MEEETKQRADKKESEGVIKRPLYLLMPLFLTQSRRSSSHTRISSFYDRPILFASLVFQFLHVSCFFFSRFRFGFLRLRNSLFFAPMVQLAAPSAIPSFSRFLFPSSNLPSPSLFVYFLFFISFVTK